MDFVIPDDEGSVLNFAASVVFFRFLAYGYMILLSIVARLNGYFIMEVRCYLTLLKRKSVYC